MTLTCREFVEVVTEYVESALPPAEAARVEQHIRDCVLCGRYYEQMLVTTRLLSRLGRDDSPPLPSPPG